MEQDHKQKQHPKRFEKGELVAARFAGHNWEVEDVGVVLDTRRSESGESHVTVITQRGVIISMREGQAAVVFHLLGEKADDMFVKMYAFMSHWQAEEDHDAGHFAEAFRKARSMLDTASAIQRASLTSTFVAR